MRQTTGRLKPAVTAIFVSAWLTAFCASGQTIDLRKPVMTDKGSVIGVSAADDTITAFKGIPFAAPPVGDLRWRPPQPAAPWPGILEASHFGPSCVQHLSYQAPTPNPVSTVRVPWTEEAFADNQQSEDCLYLNVWTPAKSAGEKRPVMVIIYGGGFTEGSTSAPLWKGGQIAKKGLVVVNIAYRLGVLGFLVHPDLARESEHHVSGNYGLLDQMAGLQWVKRNIAAFGGDPEKVTIVGQSAGAASVHDLSVSPLAKGLFRGAVPMSGSSIRGNATAPTMASLEKTGVAYAESKGAHSIKELRAVPVGSLVPSSAAANPAVRPVVDGWVLPDTLDRNAMLDLGDKGSDVPFLTGLVSDEGSSVWWTYGKLPAGEFQKQARQTYGAMADEFLKLYPSATDAESHTSQILSARERGLMGMYLFATLRAKYSKTNAYTYYFSRGTPWPNHPEFGAYHASDVYYWFGNLNFSDRPYEPVDRKLSATVMSYLTNFVTNGDPNGPGLPRWPAFSAQDKLTMKLDEEVAAIPVLSNQARFDFWVKYLSPK